MTTPSPDLPDQAATDDRLGSHQWVLPNVDPWSVRFWSWGEQGLLCIMRCTDCAYFVHPPSPVCPQCYSRSLAPHAVSGDATVVSYTVNYQKWAPQDDPPYAIAVVELVEQEGLRILSNIEECAISELRAGLEVTVRFHQHEHVWLPVFVPKGFR